MAEQVARLFQQSVDVLVERNASDWRLLRGLCIQPQRFDRGLGEQRDLIDLFEIVVLGGEPKDGNVFDAGRSRGLFRAGEWPYGDLEQAVSSGPPSETDLLSCDARPAGAAAEFGDVGEVAGPAAKAAAWRSNASARAALFAPAADDPIQARPSGSVPYHARTGEPALLSPMAR